MARNMLHAPEEIVARLWQGEALAGQAKALAEAVQAIGVTERPSARCRTDPGELKLDRKKRPEVFEREHARHRHAMPDLPLETDVLKKSASGIG